MIVLCVVSIAFGLFLLSCAWAAFDCDEAPAGLMAATSGTAFILLGLKAFV